MRITIDGRPIQVEPDTTVLDAARRLEIDIPTLCHEDGMPPNTSCFLCVVEVEGEQPLRPACALPVADGLTVRTDSPRVLEARKTALELLFSDHAGGCIAPCVRACPAHLDAPALLEALAQGRDRDAVAAVKQRLALPAVLGYVCGAHCQSACVRGEIDQPIGIRLMHRLAAERDYASTEPWRPDLPPKSGKRIAIAGAGPAGLAAAWNLTLDGHLCVVFEAELQAGGLLRRDIWDASLPLSVVDREVRAIEDLGVAFHYKWRLGRDASLDQLCERFDAVVLAIGATVDAGTDKRRGDAEFLERQGLESGKRGIAVDRNTMATSRTGVFAAGDVVAGRTGTVVRAVGAGPVLRASIGQFLRGEEVHGEADALRFWQRHTEAEKMALRERVLAGETARPTDEARGEARLRAEAARCLQCHCDALEDCRLRRYAIQYGINPYRFQGERRELAPDASHGQIVYEPGKCILCGLCIQVAREAGEERGLSFAGRGFTTQVVVPLDGAMSEGLRQAAARAAALCPTAALTLRNTAVRNRD